MRRHLDVRRTAPSSFASLPKTLSSRRQKSAACNTRIMNQTPTTRLVDAMDVYGKPRRVNRNDYDNGRIQLRLHTKRGTAYGFVPGIRESITIHRDNIAVVDGKSVRGFAPTSI